MDFSDFFNSKKTPVRETGPVRHLDGSGLERPLTVPMPLRAIMALFVVAAAIIGAIFLFNVYDSFVNAPVREAEATQQNLTREIDLGLPILKDVIQTDDATLLQIFSDVGYTLYSLTATDGSDGAGFDVIKLPADVSLVDAGLMYSRGVSNLSSADASLLLNGSWRMTVGRSASVDMNVRFADFTSPDVSTAVQNAIVAEGLAETITGEMGVDDAGNTYQTGQIEINGILYQWRVSACLLSDVYSVDGLPESASYVGIRMHQ